MATLPPIPPLPSFTPPTLKSMIDGVKIPMGQIGSLFQNPAKQAFGALESSTKGLASLGGVMSNANPGFDPTKALNSIKTTTQGITTSLTAKVSSLSTELPITMSAQALQDRVQAVDAILAKNLSAIPDQIQNAFPVRSPGKEDTGTVCPANHVEEAMAPITKSNDMVNAGNDAVGKEFDNDAVMEPLYTALNALPGVNIANGKELLAFLGDVPAPLKPQVDAILASLVTPGSAILARMEGAFAKTETTMATLTADYNKVDEDAKKAVKESTDFLTGSNVVSMTENTSPCVANVMDKVVNPEMTNPQAMAVQEGVKNKTLSLPGQEAVTATNMEKPLTASSPVNAPTTTAEEIVQPNPGKPTIVDYSWFEMSSLKNRANAQGQVVNKLDNEMAKWYKPNVEEWKKEVDYDKKKADAGFTEAHPEGTSTDPAALAAWKEVMDVWIPKRDYYNEQLAKPRNAELKKHKEMALEAKRRIVYGKFPYTYMASIGQIVPEDQQTTWLDSTK